MNRERLLLLLAVVIFLGLAAYYVIPMQRGFLSRSGKSDTVAKADVEVSQVEKNSTPSAALVRGEREIDASVPWGRNPFLTEEETRHVATERLRVNAIIFGPPKAVAVVDGRTVAVGEKIDEDKVVAIRPDAVILEREGRKKILKLDEPTVSVTVGERKR